MKTKTSLLLPLELRGKFLPGNLRQKSPHAKLGAPELLEQVAERAPLQRGERLKGAAERLGKRNVDTAFLAHGRYVATSTGSGKQINEADSIVVDQSPNNGHKTHMNTTQPQAAAPAASSTTTGKYSARQRKIYISEWLHAALMQLAKLNRAEGRAGRSFSEILVRAGTALVRQPKNAIRLRKAGVELPEAIFTKSEK
jgi:hypothetical protein